MGDEEREHRAKKNIYATLLAARVRALGMVFAMALVAAPSHAGDDIRAEPTRTAKERLGGKASDEQRAPCRTNARLA